VSEKLTCFSPWPESQRAVRVAEDAEGLANAGAAVFLATAMALPPGDEMTVALSGGSTPRRLHQILAADPIKSAIDWKRVRIFWGDERCVPPDHKDSNFKMAKETLLDFVPLDPDKIHRMIGEDGPEKGSADYEEILKRHVKRTVNGTPSLDLVFLGMGDDGHTLSLFPGTAPVHDEHRLVAPGYNANLKSHRITFTPRMANAAKLCVFLVGGAGKADVLRQVIEEPGPIAQYPSRSIKPCPGSLLWILDKGSSAKLKAETISAS
jgi:6-phosphogluconolactonase